MEVDFEAAFEQLVHDVGIDGQLLKETIIWALLEERVKVLTPPPDHLARMVPARDGLNQYWDFVQAKTDREWDGDCIRRHWIRVRKDSLTHQRSTVSMEDRLRLFFTTPRRCAQCGKEPPEVVLHVDHIEPVARGGRSGIDNLQFLCAECNEKKGAKLERGYVYDEYLC
jgi:5-methylcytosine-specific restriction enzyme A